MSIVHFPARQPRWLFCAVLLIAVPAAPASAMTYRHVLIKDVPHVRQKDDFCGEACAAMFLQKLGADLDQDFVFDQSGLDPLQGRGCYTPELATALKRIGFRIGPVWHGVPPRDTQAIQKLFDKLYLDLAAGIPSILCMHYDGTESATEHFRLIVGYDPARDEVIYHEPAENRGAYRRMKRSDLFAWWPLKYDANEWTLVRFRLLPPERLPRDDSPRLTNADYAQDILQLRRELAELRQRQVRLKQQRDEEIREEAEKERIAKEKDEEYEPKKLTPRIVSDFHIVLQEPFVVVGDEPASVVESHAQGTIRWAVQRLKRDFFPKNPNEVIRIWLFKDKLSYEQNTRDLFNWRPHTPFGYYSPRHQALVMNISTGGGTLVHEIVHPFMAANVPNCPAWFNEGLGSLYEQCQDNNGHIWGVTNWRLRGLQEALEDEEYELPTFKQLCSTTTREFYNEDPGTNYAQARYLCYYLQEQGLLLRFFRELQASLENDTGGYEALKKVLGRDDEEAMKEFQAEWQAFVMELRF